MAVLLAPELRDPERSDDLAPAGPAWQVSSPAGPGRDVFADFSERLRRVVPFDAAGWFALDPATLLPTSPTLIENIETGQCYDYWERECLVEDVLLYTDLARGSQPASTLHAATDGRPARSARFREQLEPMGIKDELRAAFRLGNQTWGVVDLLRDRSQEPFSARDVQRVAALAPSIASAIAGLATAAASTAASVDPTTIGTGPGTALFDARGELSSIDSQAERWFEALGGVDWFSTGALHGMTAALVARAEMVARGRHPGPASTRLRTPDGRWLMLHASRLRRLDGTPGMTSLIIEPATSMEVAHLIVEAYALTPREQEVTQAVARGLSNVEIGAQLFLSPHTVRDHLKAVFAKTDVSSRGELVAKLFAEHYGPAHEVQAQHNFW
jgi:DNA-binding CsgD family transcriptional regulator